MPVRAAAVREHVHAGKNDGRRQLVDAVDLVVVERKRWQRIAGIGIRHARVDRARERAAEREIAELIIRADAERVLPLHVRRDHRARRARQGERLVCAGRGVAASVVVKISRARAERSDRVIQSDAVRAIVGDAPASLENA